MANRCLVRLYENGRLKRVGKHWFSEYHWTCIYGITETRTLEHDVYRTQVWDAYRPDDFTIERCPYNEDMAMVIDTETYRVEIDRDTEGRERVLDRFKRYAACTDQMLFLTLSHERIRRVKRWAESVKDIIFFATIQDSICDPYGQIYTDVEGAVYSVPKPVAQTVPMPDSCGTPTPP